MWCNYVKPVQILKRYANDFFCWDEILNRRLGGQMLRDHVSRRIFSRIGMTLQSLEIYGYIGSKTKSYWILRGFFLLFIFLGYPVRSCLSGLAFLPPDLSSGSIQWVTLPSFAITLMPSIAKVSDPRSVEAIK